MGLSKEVRDNFQQLAIGWVSESEKKGQQKGWRGEECGRRGEEGHRGRAQSTTRWEGRSGGG